MFSLYGIAGLILALGAIGFALALTRARRWPIRVSATIVAGALAFQVFHVLEHGLQVVAWAADPGGRPWMSAWASGTAAGAGDWFAFLAPETDKAPAVAADAASFCVLAMAGGREALGSELLHLFGNVIFLAGIVMMTALPQLAAPRHTRRALVAQGVHVAEHVLLTTTLIIGGTAHGASTMLDDVLPLGATTTRVLFHFGINAVGTVFAVAAVVSVGWRPWADALGLSEPEAPDVEPAGLTS